jgi:protein tyrosine phosphatase (PTP) superfamily phosphohydrolase (DUF442 family)
VKHYKSVGSIQLNTLPRTLKTFLGLIFLFVAANACIAQVMPLKAPNVVEISTEWVTSGQPSADALANLKALGFDSVIYLAPPTVLDAVRDEQLIVTKQGLTFINIPIRFDQPTERDFENFSALLKSLSGRKVLVHCQINLRASSMMFLHRVITQKEEPRTAFEAVSKVWSPDPVWKRFMEGQLRKHSVSFEIL